MSYIRQYPLDAGASNHISQIGQASNAHNLHSGPGLKLTHNSQGIHLSNTLIPKSDSLIWKGEYNTFAEYFPYDEVFVSSESTYLDPTNGNSLSIPPGTYVCTTYVPPAINNVQSFTNVVNAYGHIVSNDLANTYRWYQFNNYYPTSITYIPTTGSYGLYSIQASQSFWKPIGGGTIKISYFNDSASYTHNTDIVLVDPTHAPFSASMYPFSGSSTPNIGVGTYLCAIDVPFLVTSSSTNSGSRSPYNVYYPFWPPIPSGSLKLVNSTDQWSGSLANQNYWFPITPMSPLCIEGTTLFISYLDPSGSFNVNNLPYKS